METQGWKSFGRLANCGDCKGGEKFKTVEERGGRGAKVAVGRGLDEMREDKNRLSLSLSIIVVLAVSDSLGGFHGNIK